MKNLASLKPAVSHRENVEEKKPDKHDDTNAKIGNVIKYIVGMEGGEKVNSLSQRKERLNHILLSVDSISERIWIFSSMYFLLLSLNSKMTPYCIMTFAHANWHGQNMISIPCIIKRV